MRKLQIDQLTPGMILAATVSGCNGRLLLTAGEELTDRRLMILRTWGIREVEIEGAGEDCGEVTSSIPAEITPEQLDKAKTELLSRFRHADLQQPAMSELLQLAAIRKVRHG